MDAKRIAEIRARVDAAAPGPWGVWSSMDNTLDVLSEATHPFLPLLSFYGNDQSLPSLQEKRNAEFVAASRQDIPDLLAALDAARADVARLRAALNEISDVRWGEYVECVDIARAALAATEAQP